MLLKERRYNLIFSAIREIIINSDKDIGVLINYDKLVETIKDKFNKDELRYAIRHLVYKNYLVSYNGKLESYSELKLTMKGFNEWLFPYGPEDSKKIFISYATDDKKLAGKIKCNMEKIGFTIFLAHEDIPAIAIWRDKLISELKTSGIFIALRTQNYTGRQYTEQECGFALALNKRILSLCISTKSSKMGFCSEFQGKYFNDDNI
ncbi:MAG: toll/interleukin-1 receptor domain-containing protein, partial [Patescibacteria group bacterium]|nr:toll/interleukin-1 receptor domain-containing protein [Patescibacteria group bacterium]